MMSHVTSRHNYMSLLLICTWQVSWALAAPVARSSTAATPSFDSISSTTPPSLAAIPTLPVPEPSTDAQAADSLLSILSTSKCHPTSSPLPATAITRREWDPIEKPYFLALFMLSMLLVGIIVACRTCKGCAPKVHPGDAYLQYTRQPVVETVGQPADSGTPGHHHPVAPVALVGAEPGTSVLSVYSSQARRDQGHTRTREGRLLGSVGAGVSGQ